ncbi:hypothetical protein BC940DRAFT_293033 [Gongronella butleri]|nr:hypothetical protein BC940DRAFT_293033 [Gongronella butleri]
MPLVAKGKQKAADLWNGFASSDSESDNSDSDSSSHDDEAPLPSPTIASKRARPLEALEAVPAAGKRVKKAATTLLSLPHELLCDIFVFSGNAALPLACRTLLYQLYHVSPIVKVQWLLKRANNDPSAAAYQGIQFPFFNTDILVRLEHYHVVQQQLTERQEGNEETQDENGRNQNENRENRENQDVCIRFDDKALPTHLFTAVAHESRTTEGTSSGAAAAEASADMHEARNTLLAALLKRGASATRPNGYPLIKSAQLGDLAKVQLLVDHGADPAHRNNMALRICASRNNMPMARYFLETLHVQPDSDTLKTCAQKQLWEMVQLLMDHGAVPDMSTINFT